MWTYDASYKERFGSIVAFFQQYVFFGSVSLGILLYTLILVSINALFIYRNFQVEEARASKLQTQLAESRLQALKMQLQPHFLFNTLHSISSLVLIDPPRANEMLARLGEFLRLTLEQTDAHMVSLEEEIQFLRAYLEIEQTRFQDRLKVSYEIEPEVLRFSVPHLILQPLIENAVKHGIAPFAAHGGISVRARDTDENLHLQIENSFPAQTLIHENGKNHNGGKGLANVAARLEEIYGANHDFQYKKQTDGFVVDLRLPKKEQ
jgi:LytS/YehU family sensor histidine kinase